MQLLRLSSKFIFLALLTACAAAQTTRAVDSPLPADRAIEHMKIAPGVKVELVASEPDVVDPVAIRFDEAGRMWVVEMSDYPNGPNKGEAPKSRIKLLEDRNGDGRYEHATIFADKLLFATGVQPWRGGVIATIAGEVVYMKDTNGDGAADHRETWFKGFAQENPQLRANHPTLGLDNRIYIANGLRGGAVLSTKQPNAKPVPISGKDFRFDPFTFKPEALTGAGQFGLTFDDHGNRFVCSNRNPLKQIVLEDRFLKRNSLAAVRTAVHDVALAGADSRVYPISRAWTTSNLHAGQFTAACGATIYRGTALPRDLKGNGFTCDPTGNLVHREIITPKGTTFAAKPARDGVEFLASPDEWFRPVNLENGPDGALYVVDMYRAVIEHPQFVPEELKKRPDERYGDDRGRIYRVVPTQASSKKEPNTFAGATTKQLVAGLTSANAWHRETSARLLLERLDAEAIPHLKALVTHESGTAATQALWLLRNHDALNAAVLLTALSHPNASVRRQAIIVWDEQLRDASELREKVVSLCSDSDATVRTQVALCLAPIERDEVEQLAKAVLVAGADEWVAKAVTIAAGTHPSGVLAAVMKAKATKGQAIQQCAADLAALGAAQGDVKERRRTLQAIMTSANVELRRAALLSYCDTLRRRGTPLAAIQQGLAPAEQTQLDAIFAAAKGTLRDETAPPSARVAAMQLFVHAPSAEETLRALVTPNHSQGIRLAAIAAISRFKSPAAWVALTAGFERESPAIRRAIVNGLLSSNERTSLLLERVAEGKIKPGELDRSQSTRLLKHRDPTLRSRATKLFADAIPGDRKKVLADYQVALKLPADPLNGRAVFKKNCATCHRVGEVGVNVAPDISDSRTKQPLQIMTDILQPNRAIDNNYLSYSVITTGGRVLTGILTAETASSITLKQAEGKIETLLRDEIEALKSNGVSLMPEGLEKNVSHQQMADLVSFIKNWRYLDGKTPLGKPLSLR